MPHAPPDSCVVLAIFADARFYTSFALIPRGAPVTCSNSKPCVLMREPCTQSDGRRLLRHAARITVDGVNSLGITYEWDDQMVSFGGRYSLDEDYSDLSGDDENQNPVRWKLNRAWWNGDRASTTRTESCVARSDIFYVRDSCCKRRDLRNEIIAQAYVARDALLRAKLALTVDNVLRDRLCRAGLSAACGAGWLLA